MPKNKEIVSRVKNQLEFLTKDDSTSDRFILHTARNIATTYISQKLREMTLGRESNLYREVSCVELEKIDPVLCGLFEFKSCESIMKTKKRLPDLINSKLGSSVRYVTDMLGDAVFKEITPAQYRRNKNRISKSRDNYFYIKDNYVYLLDSNVKMINIDTLVLDLYDLNLLSECSESCLSAWDYDFVCPDKLLESVIEATISQLSVKKQIVEDDNPNMSVRS